MHGSGEGAAAWDIGKNTFSSGFLVQGRRTDNAQRASLFLQGTFKSVGERAENIWGMWQKIGKDALRAAFRQIGNCYLDP